MKWLVALLLVPLAAAQPGDYGDYEDYDYGDCVEGVELSGGGSAQIVYEYGYVCEGEVRGVEFIFSTGSDPDFLLEAGYVKGDPGNGGSVFGAELEVGLLGIAIYEDMDGDGAYDPDTDETLEQDSFSAAGWGPIESGREGKGVEFTVDYDISFGGTFTVSGKATGESYSAGGVRVTPSDTKIDFGFRDINYPTQTARIALALGIGSEVGSVSGGSPGGIQGNEGGIAVGGEQSAYFTWAKTAEVDGRTTPVRVFEDLRSESASIEGDGASVHGEEVHGAITFSYEQGAEIVHDPRLGVAFSNTSKGSPMPVLLVLPALAVALWARRD